MPAFTIIETLPLLNLHAKETNKKQKKERMLYAFF